MSFLQKVQFWQFFILHQEGSNAQQRAYLYQRTLNYVKNVQKKHFKIFHFSKKSKMYFEFFLLPFEIRYLGNIKS